MKGQGFQNKTFLLKNGLKSPRRKKKVVESLQNILLCIVGELAWEGSVSVAVGISDMWHVEGDPQHVTGDRWPLTMDSFFSTKFGISLKLMLLSAHVGRFSVSRKGDFFAEHYSHNLNCCSYKHHLVHFCCPYQEIVICGILAHKLRTSII